MYLFFFISLVVHGFTRGAYEKARVGGGKVANDFREVTGE